MLSFELVIMSIILIVFVSRSESASIIDLDGSIEGADVFHDALNEETSFGDTNIFFDPSNDFEVYDKPSSMIYDAHDDYDNKEEFDRLKSYRAGCLKADAIECRACCGREGSLLSFWDTYIGCVCIEYQESV